MSIFLFHHMSQVPKYLDANCYKMLDLPLLTAKNDKSFLVKRKKRK